MLQAESPFWRNTLETIDSSQVRLFRKPCFRKVWRAGHITSSSNALRSPGGRGGDRQVNAPLGGESVRIDSHKGSSQWQVRLSETPCVAACGASLLEGPREIGHKSGPGPSLPRRRVLGAVHGTER